ncbi:uncharacterized protein LOC108098132 [Drosophila ficusphila]|uniref:uncharacterized protein LOC108098132 n=1 Tax=Drosophila ficusphila TaxID=30025 RepID=UPI0007E619D3|nr:uncharacterized protein LOC108098132 [Drosophila ficusphila]
MNYQDIYGSTYESENPGRGSNLEFRFTGPESIPNAVRRYNAMRGAELAQMKRLRDKSQVPSMPRFCKVRQPGQDVNSMVTSRDLDVVTQLSLDSQTEIENFLNGDGDNDKDEEDVQLPRPPSPPLEVRLCGGAESPKRVKKKSRSRKRQPAATVTRRRRQLDPVQSGQTLERLEELHREVCAELQTMGGPPKTSPNATPRATGGHRNPTKGRRNRMSSRKTEAEGQSSMAAEGRVSFEDYHTPQPKWVDIMPSAMVSQAIRVNVCHAQDATPLAAYQFMEQHGSLEPEPLTPFFLEDSDLEHEYADRQGYLRYVEPRPSCSSSDEETPQRQLPTGGSVQPCFVELEHRPHRLSLLRSLSPMRYTSQRSEETLRSLADREDREVVVPPLDLRRITNQKRGTQKSQVARNQRSAKIRKTKGKENPTNANGNANTNSRLRKPVRSAAGGELLGAVQQNPNSNPNTNPNAILNPPKVATTQNKGNRMSSPERAGKKRKPKPLVVYSKSLEDLKFEKLGIYNKITLTQERIISALDKLQASLLQLQVPSCSAQERQKRQRNAFEFCVRFSRNFLYPLKGMIDDVRITSVASFNSATSNEACQRVVCVYGLMQQSIQTYQRQLRYFLLEKVPQKLSALVEMIYTMTNCCLDKGMLDRHDPVVECLLERCTRFLSFIEDMQEERFKLAREALRRMHRTPTHPVAGHSANPHHRKKKPSSRMPTTQPRQEKLRSHQRYDLKMCLNDLKLYEPRLVPKERQPADKRLRVRRPRNHPSPGVAATGTAPVELPSDLQEPPSIAGDDIQTQMQLSENNDVTTISSSQSMMPTLGYFGGAMGGMGPMGDSLRQWKQGELPPYPQEEQLHRALLDALHLVSRSQVQQVLDPLMKSLGVILGEKLGGGGTHHNHQNHQNH